MRTEFGFGGADWVTLGTGRERALEYRRLGKSGLNPRFIGPQGIATFERQVSCRRSCAAKSTIQMDWPVVAYPNNPNTGKPLSLATIDATLRMVKAFFQWLAREPGYKRAIRYADVEYFNNNLKNARAVHSHRPTPYPSMQSAFHAFQAMPNQTEMQRRDKAMFAFVMLTGARDGAAASLRLKHINLVDHYVFQDGREVKTKNSKTILTTFFPVEPEYLACFAAWVTYLRNDKLFGPEDALFPKPRRDLIGGKFAFVNLSRAPYADASKLYTIVKTAFIQTQQPAYMAQSCLLTTRIRLLRYACAGMTRRTCR